MKPKKTFIFFLLSLFCIWVLSVAFALPSGETVKQGVGACIDTYLARITPFGFSGAVLVAKGDEILLNKGYGLADREKKIPNTSETVFCVGSITKQFTAAAIMTLEMKGLLKTEDLLSKYLDGVPSDKSGITLHHLLTHTSGLVPDVGGDYETAGRDETVRKIMALPLEFKLGERFAYSNVNYTLLAAVIEKVSGKSYEEYLHENLFKPAAMEWTGFRIPMWGERVVSHWYVGRKDNLNSLSRPFPYWNLIGNGGILSMTGDMFKWHRALEGEKVLSAAAKKKLFTPFLNDYAYGWDVLKTDRGTLIQHNGASQLGNNAEIRRYMDAGIVTIILSNQFYSGRPLIDAVRDKIERLAFGGEVDLPPAVSEVSTDSLKEFEGVYSLPSGAELDVAAEEGGLTIGAKGQDAVNTLVFSDVADWQAINDITTRSVAVMDAAWRGNYSPLAEVLADREKRLPRVRDFIERRVRGESDRTGPIQKVEALYTKPSDIRPGAVETVVVLQGEKGNVFFRLIWSGGLNIGVGPVDLIVPVVLLFRQLSGKEFVGYDLATAKTTRIRFELTPGQEQIFVLGQQKIQAVRR